MKQNPVNADPAALTALGKIALATMQYYDEAAKRLGADVDFLTVAAAGTTFTAKRLGTWKLTMERVDQQGTLDLTAEMEIGEPRVIVNFQVPAPSFAGDVPQVDRRTPPLPDARWDELNMRWIEPRREGSLLREAITPSDSKGPISGRYKPDGFA